MTSSLTGALLGANAAPARPAQKTSYKLVVPVLIIAILIVVGAAAGITFLARDGIGDFINQIIRGG